MRITMNLLKAVHLNDWSMIDQLNEAQALEPLELRKEQEAVIIARIKKLAKDPKEQFPNALALVHRSYEEQEWERQDSIGDIVRPSPSDRKAWAQYEDMIKVAVKMLSKFRGSKGDWRSDAFDTVPTNQRASMGSMAAARVSESTIRSNWQSLAMLNIVMEAVHDDDTTFRNNGVYENTTLGAVADRVVVDASELGYIVTEGASTDDSISLTIYDDQCEVVDCVKLCLQD